MKIFGDRLRERAKMLSLSHAEVARRSGLSERRFSNYVTGLREPDLATLTRIAAALETSPDVLLGVSRTAPSTKRSALTERLVLAAESLSDEDLDMTIMQVVALAGWRKQAKREG
ncbi:helix-turn-helix domain-containing protein [Methylobacterium aerolatum]|uniref:Transcriptional regulator with XRE-family HTH domain n=1 Tax=Methylobacterium aerolatum TaxID=418708 RepID=A0ABU0I1F6_9HYPH|nr:helix-turn-helix transcriptional regulator [Methylobacterium aerolatum]MDQ0448425.1 transcriptional regulator with XRE-family HTH domain [Methylobacterium aerolatum]GJD34507.1 hypothetical protein FMGBMHLM_1409 [Methylobacterium aerolatum]